VERAAEELSIDEPIDAHHIVARHRYEVAVDLHRGAATHETREFQSDAIEGICANPLREEPHPAVIRAVTRFGLVGLVACALGAAGARWWKSLRA
jgi:hypothetical protein